MGNSCTTVRAHHRVQSKALPTNGVNENHENHEKLKTFVTYISMSGTGASVPPLTTHVLDTARGLPAGCVSMVLHHRNKSGVWEQLETVTTNPDGRGAFLRDSNWTPGVYKLYFDTESYFASQQVKGFYPYVEVVFQIEDPGQHYHVPLLLSPYGYSTYRGS